MFHFVLPSLQLQFENNTALLRIICYICQSSLGVSETLEHLQLTKKWSLSLEINLQNPFNLPLSSSVRFISLSKIVAQCRLKELVELQLKTFLASFSNAGT